jgi:hypothetical protein
MAGLVQGKAKKVAHLSARGGCNNSFLKIYFGIYMVRTTGKMGRQLHLLGILYCGHKKTYLLMPDPIPIERLENETQGVKRRRL